MLPAFRAFLRASPVRTLAAMKRAAIVLLVSLGLSGCLTTHECTEMGCVAGLTVDLRSASGAWAAGTYRFGIMADGVSLTCSATLPFASAQGDGTPPCSSGDVRLGLSGSALPAAQHAITDLVFTTSPRSVAVSITRDAKPFASATLSPTYATSQPNGPECGPTCRSGREVVDVP